MNSNAKPIQPSLSASALISPTVVSASMTLSDHRPPLPSSVSRSNPLQIHKS